MSKAAPGDTLQCALAQHPGHALCVALSGGPDSSALLHALSQLSEARERGLRAIHVDHGLHPDSRRWAEHCQAFCDALDVPIEIEHIEVDRASGTGLEAAARDARYAAFAATLGDGEALLTAHHADDQVETVLLKLLRGAGPEGLGGMRAWRAFAAGWLWRPLLDTPRATLDAYVREHALACIDDPSNQSTHYARNRLRNEVIPRLLAHWPQAAQSIQQSAALSRQAADYLSEQSARMLDTMVDTRDNSLDASAWLALHPALRGTVLDQWLHAQGLNAPSRAQREQLRRQASSAAADRVPLVDWPGTVVRVWRGRLYAHPPLPDVPAHWTTCWRGEELALPAASGTLQLVPVATTTGSEAPTLEVHLGETGLHLRPSGRHETHVLRKLFQQAGIPPWQRRRCPTIYASDGTLLAVADLWQTDAGRTLFDALGRHPRWLRHTAPQAHAPPD